MADPSSGNGAEVKTPGGWLLRLGGPMALLGAAFAAMTWLGWMDRQDIIRRTDARYEDVREQILAELQDQRTELRLLRCAVKMGAIDLLTNSQRLQTDQDWAQYCRWLEHHTPRVRPAPPTPPAPLTK